MDHETSEEIDRHFGVIAEGLRSEIRAVAEQLRAFRQTFKRDITSLRQETLAEFGEVKALLI